MGYRPSLKLATGAPRKDDARRLWPLPSRKRRDRGHQFRRIDRLRQVHFEAALHGSHAVFRPGKRSQRSRRDFSNADVRPTARTCAMNAKPSIVGIPKSAISTFARLR